jgi:hypothetical protein
MTASMTAATSPLPPVRFSVDYPDRPLNRMTSALRVLAAVPILAVLVAVSGSSVVWSRGGQDALVGAGGLLFLGPLLMIVFRGKYPRWWFEWNLELQRFTSRVVAYLALMDDRYPSTDEQQSVHLDYTYPDGQQDLKRWMPLVKWLLVLPHVVVLFFLWIATACAVIAAWFAILFTGRYPRRLFGFVEGVMRWDQRVIAYAVVLTTDQYPPFTLAAHPGER